MGQTGELLWSNRGAAVLTLIAFLGVTLFSEELASAQSVFCPAAVPSAPAPVNSVPNITQIAGNCTNPKIAGAASGSALASQAIGDVAGSAANQATSVATKAIEERRNASPEPCPPDEILVDGICKARPAPVSVAPDLAPNGINPQATAEVAPGSLSAPRAAKRVKTKGARRAPVLAAPPPAPISPQPLIYDQSFRIGSWAQGLGGYDHRTGDRNSVIDCCTAQPGNTNITPLLLEAASTTWSGGFVGGIDGTKRGWWSAQDGVVVGLLGEYTWTRISLGTTTLSAIPSQTASGFSSSTAYMKGPGVGVYATYFNQGLSNSLLFKEDFYSMNEDQSQILGFGACSCFGLNTSSFVAPQSGSWSTNFSQLTFSDDLSYHVTVAPGRTWIEPTVGALYSNSTYSSSAAVLGLSDGYLFRIQGGARVGMDSVVGANHVTTVLTGLVFDNVIVHGYNIQGQGFGTSGAILSDQGKVQAEAIASINVDFGGGLSGSVQGYAYGGRDIFGAGGQATLRKQW